ncbi:MAG TPA: hypothetical protein VHC97_13170 [Thermoanaerobaculia bacterium]|nr:hypothetical protein [Thermoanaerobaculia bacterium]
MKRSSVLAVFVLSLLFGLSPLAAEPMIERGIDIFTTPADGRTFYDFAKNPIPAGFFCKGSKPFRGRIAFRGLPLATAVPGQLESADTVVERLDDAVFDNRGRARTRLRFAALSLVSIAPVKTSCGAFHAYVSLGGRQRVTTMDILRTQESGGKFIAPLAVDILLTFIPVNPVPDKSVRKLELTSRFTFPATVLSWSFTGNVTSSDTVVVDTNGDLVPDRQFPAPANFSPGRPPSSLNKVWCCPYTSCHATDGCEHCTEQYPRGCTGQCP